MFSNVLVPLDRSSLAEQALGQAAAIARASQAAIDLVLVHEPLQLSGYRDGALNDDMVKADEAYLDSVATELSSGASVPVTHAVLRGSPADMICARARETGANLIVMTSHGRTGLSRVWLGSVADAVVRRSTVPVLMLRPIDKPADRVAARHLFHRILVPLDGSRLASEALEPAASLAQCSDASVVLLRMVQPVPLVTPFDINQPFVYPPPIPDAEATDQVVQEASRRLDEVARDLQERSGVKVEAKIVVAGRVAEDIIDFARGDDVDVIAMSTRGRGASRLLLGSIADKLLRASALPMLLRRPVGVDGDESLLSAADVAEQLPALSTR
jgi:nucleotide-binding universal stress UspA family protein